MNMCDKSTDQRPPEVPNVSDLMNSNENIDGFMNVCDSYIFEIGKNGVHAPQGETDIKCIRKKTLLEAINPIKRACRSNEYSNLKVHNQSVIVITLFVFLI